MTTVDFIRSVAFVRKNDGTIDEATLATLDFKYKVAQEGTGTPRDATLTVPLISVVPIPYVNIDDITIDFRAKITSVETLSTETDLKVDAKFKLNYKIVSLKVSVALQRKTKQAQETTRDYSMNVLIKASGQDVPEGMARVLGILEGLVKERVQ